VLTQVATWCWLPQAQQSKPAQKQVNSLKRQPVMRSHKPQPVNSSRNKVLTRATACDALARSRQQAE
jgi:hypothetical protein